MEAQVQVLQFTYNIPELISPYVAFIQDPGTLAMAKAGDYKGLGAYMVKYGFSEIPEDYVFDRMEVLTCPKGNTFIAIPGTYRIEQVTTNNCVTVPEGSRMALAMDPQRFSDIVVDQTVCSIVESGDVSALLDYFRKNYPHHVANLDDISYVVQVDPGIYYYDDSLAMQFLVKLTPENSFTLGDPGIGLEVGLGLEIGPGPGSPLTMAGLNVPTELLLYLMEIYIERYGAIEFIRTFRSLNRTMYMLTDKIAVRKMPSIQMDEILSLSQCSPYYYSARQERDIRRNYILGMDLFYIAIYYEHIGGWDAAESILSNSTVYSRKAALYIILHTIKEASEALASDLGSVLELRYRFCICKDQLRISKASSSNIDDLYHIGYTISSIELYMNSSVIVSVDIDNLRVTWDKSLDISLFTYVSRKMSFPKTFFQSYGMWIAG
jgi:hypothetical protein